MQVARLTFAARRRSDRPFRISPLTIYEANFREKLTNFFQITGQRLRSTPGLVVRFLQIIAPLVPFTAAPIDKQELRRFFLRGDVLS